MRDYKGKEADVLVTRIDPGVVSLVAELRGHERQAAEESGQRKTHHEERKPLDALLVRDYKGKEADLFLPPSTWLKTGNRARAERTRPVSRRAELQTVGAPGESHPYVWGGVVKLGRFSLR